MNTEAALIRQMQSQERSEQQIAGLVEANQKLQAQVGTLMERIDALVVAVEAIEALKAEPAASKKAR